VVRDGGWARTTLLDGLLALVVAGSVGARLSYLVQNDPAAVCAPASG
jgi:hypothetical protein